MSFGKGVLEKAKAPTQSSSPLLKMVPNPQLGLSLLY